MAQSPTQSRRFRPLRGGSSPGPASAWSRTRALGRNSFSFFLREARCNGGFVLLVWGDVIPMLGLKGTPKRSRIWVSLILRKQRLVKEKSRWAIFF